MSIERLPIDVFQQIIMEYLDGNLQLFVKSILYDDRLYVTNFYDIPDELQKKICDNDLKMHTRIKKLDASYNKNITDEGMRHLKLSVLNASGNQNITDEGIKEMKLRILEASFNNSITDRGIKGKDLYALDASGCDNITDDGIKGMKLIQLNVGYNNNITDAGLKNMHTLKWLWAAECQNISERFNVLYYDHFEKYV